MHNRKDREKTYKKFVATVHCNIQYSQSLVVCARETESRERTECFMCSIFAEREMDDGFCTTLFVGESEPHIY